MRVLKYSATDIVFAHDGTDAGECDVQTCPLWNLRREESRLHFADAARFGVKGYGEDRCGRRMRFKVEVQQLNQELFVGRWL